MDEFYSAVKKLNFSMRRNSSTSFLTAPGVLTASVRLSELANKKSDSIIKIRNREIVSESKPQRNSHSIVK